MESTFTSGASGHKLPSNKLELPMENEDIQRKHNKIDENSKEDNLKLHQNEKCNWFIIHE